MLAVAAAGPAIGQPPGDPSAFDSVPLRGAALDDIIGQFESICLATALDPARFDAAIRASRWRFVEERRAGRPAQDRRSSPEAAIVFNRPPVAGARGFGLPQCNFDAATLELEERNAVYTAIESALRRTIGSVPRRRITERSTCWRWASDAATFPRLCMMHWRGMHPRQITLSYQFWTGEMERRAGSVPAMEAAK